MSALRPTLRALVERFELNLAGLTVLTEAASGAYSACASLCALAGAKVLVSAHDSAYGTGAELITQTLSRAQEVGVTLEVVAPSAQTFGRADIITNAAGLRPLDAIRIGWMKPTAVIPLMYEPWELRAADVDLAACKAHGILLLGTDESASLLDFKRWFGPLGRALLARLGVGSGRIVVLGSGLGEWVAQRLALGEAGRPFEVVWFADTPGARPYTELSAFFAQPAAGCAAVICAEHRDPVLLVGDGGLLKPERVAGIPIGHICGAVDAVAIARVGGRIEPPPRPFGYMSFQPYHLGDDPVYELFAAGLAVGQIMARSRLAGLDTEQAAAAAVATGLAADFAGSRSWIAPDGR